MSKGILNSGLTIFLGSTGIPNILNRELAVMATKPAANPVL